ncbi:MAG: DUF58 domain-containing protein, partial [Myxococcales bacterium]|nr:DUF58 domain-containing protein [Myxococcales bacterium]
MVPTRRLAVLAFVATLVSIVAGFLPALRPALLAIDAALLAGALADVLWA